MARKIGKEAVDSAKPLHPGAYVREKFLTPRDLTVSAAAKLVGVGRPAFSNFLNGNADATPAMAARIEVAFGMAAQEVMQMQATYDAAQARAGGKPVNAIPYVAPFLGIKSAAIEAWADRNIGARTRLAVLLRTLVNSTGFGITKSDFPGNDDAERPGWDGYVESAAATPWIPEGNSGWEFGTNKEVPQKANGDFEKSIRATTKEERSQSTFVFVTPRHWPGKHDWVKKHAKIGGWKGVRAYDSSDLEQWLGQSIPAQAWFADETSIPAIGVRSLDRCWADWADVADPPLAPSFFAPAIEAARRTIASRLAKEPTDPTVIAADSVEEALAFLSQILGPAGGEGLGCCRDRVLVFDRPEILPKLALGERPFIAVTSHREVERELGPLSRRIHSFVVYPRNATNVDPHVTLEPLDYETFNSALGAMGYGRDDISKLTEESGRSLTILRRRLSSFPAIRTPGWAADHETARSLIPFLFVGAWNSANKSDKAALALLCDGDDESIERTVQHFASLNDPPLWSLGNYRGAISKIDLLFAIAGSITSKDLQIFFDVAEIVLGEDDPSLDLPEDQRWAASIWAKSRDFSGALRSGISETVVLLAIHGNKLFQSRLGFDCEHAARRLVRALLTPVTTRTLEAHQNDLPAYAEGSPEEFLSILEADLRTVSPACYGLLRPVDSGIFGGGCPRSGLLWALEGLAWNPDTLPRVALILAQLSEIELTDNWANKPFASLEAIFRSWMPQTTVNEDGRLRILELIATKHPMVAWNICMAQLHAGNQIGGYSHKPKWRNDAYGHGEPLRSNSPMFSFMRKVVDMALAWEGGYSTQMLRDLVEKLHALSVKDQAKVWALVGAWAEAAPDEDKALVCETVRTTVLSRRGQLMARRHDVAGMTAVAKKVMSALEPTDVLSRHQWLFRSDWVDDSADEIHGDDYDFKKRDERISNHRVSALREVLASKGILGVLQLAETGNASGSIGRHVARDLMSGTKLSAFVLDAVARCPDDTLSLPMKSLIASILHGVNDADRAALLKDIGSQLSEQVFAQVLQLAPFRRNTWGLVDQLQGEHQASYWRDVGPGWIYDEEDEAPEAIERLLAAKRPRAAFSAIRLKPNTVGPELLYRILFEIVNGARDKANEHQLESHSVETAFQLIDKCQALTLEQKAGLEFAYIEILARPWNRSSYGIPNLERYVEQHPQLFIQAIAWRYKRKDGGEDPPELEAEPDQVEQRATRAYKLLEAITRTPGHDDMGELRADRLAAWVKTVRDACKELGRLDIADVCLGKLLSAAPTSDDGTWPCPAVAQVMEEIHSTEMMEGAHTGIYNARGTVWRGEGGGQERELADKYRAWANALRDTYPFVASKLLMGMVRTYELEARREDTEAGVRRRLRN